MKVLIADDHKIVRDGLRLLLESEPEFQIDGEAETGRQALEHIEANDPDIVLLDLRMPDMSGFDVLEALDKMERAPCVLVLSMHDDLAFVRRAIQLGAEGYLLKSVGRDELLRALRSVCEGRPYVQDDLTRTLIASIDGNREVVPLSVSFTDRQRGVLEALAEGLDNREIGTKLGMSESTVKAELRAVYATLGVTRRSEAVAVGFRLGILT